MLTDQDLSTRQERRQNIRITVMYVALQCGAWIGGSVSRAVPDANLPSHIPAKPSHNHDIVSEHFNNFSCMGICDKLSRHLSMLTYLYLNVDKC